MAENLPLPDEAPTPEQASPRGAVPEGASETDTPDSAAAAAVPDLPPAACANRLAELFPAVFTPHAPKPLKLRIQADIQQRAPGVFSKKSLSVFLHRHTTSTSYLRALLASPQRVGLDGEAAGDMAEEHRQAATAELERRKALHEVRRAAERDVQRQAFDEARRERAAQDDARRNRAALLRAFEATTLTRSNFCALKGLSEVELDAALAQARQEPEPQPGRPARAEPQPGRATRPEPRPAMAGRRR